MKDDSIKLPPLFLPGAIGKYTKKEMQSYAREAIEPYAKRIAELEADRKRRGEPVGAAGTMPGTSGFTMACFPADKVPVGTSLYTAPQPAEPDLDKCAECGAEMIHVRPGKWQHPDCPQSPGAAEPVSPNEEYKPEYKYCEDGRVVWTNAADAPVVKSAEPVAFSFELASTRSGDGEYTNWSPRLSYSMPNVPAGSIRNLQWLYADPLPHSLRQGGNDGR